MVFILNNSDYRRHTNIEGLWRVYSCPYLTTCVSLAVDDTAGKPKRVMKTTQNETELRKV